jgi:membrane-associated phospholipid phosphatase
MAKALPFRKGPFAGRTRRRWLRWILRGLIPAMVLVVIAHLLDRPVHGALAVSKTELNSLEEEDLYWLLRGLGSLWPWLLIATALYMHDRSPPPLGPRRGLGVRHDSGARAVTVAGSAIAAGLAVELLKLIIGRERPTRLDETGTEFIEQIYTFKQPLGAFFGGGNLGMPSSHAATAFGGAVALAILMPTLRPLILGLACLSGMMRIVASAHTLSDVVVGAAVGAVMGMVVYRAVYKHMGPDRIPSWAFGERG